MSYDWGPLVIELFLDIACTLPRNCCWGIMTHLVRFKWDISPPLRGHEVFSGYVEQNLQGPAVRQTVRFFGLEIKNVL